MNCNAFQLISNNYLSISKYGTPKSIGSKFHPKHSGDSAVAATDMTFWMVQKHELKFWKTGNVRASKNNGHLREIDAVVMAAWKLDAGGSEISSWKPKGFHDSISSSFFPHFFDGYLKHCHERRIADSGNRLGDNLRPSFLELWDCHMCHLAVILQMSELSHLRLGEIIIWRCSVFVWGREFLMVLEEMLQKIGLALHWFSVVLLLCFTRHRVAIWHCNMGLWQILVWGIGSNVYYIYIVRFFAKDSMSHEDVSRHGSFQRKSQAFFGRLWETSSSIVVISSWNDKICSCFCWINFSVFGLPFAQVLAGRDALGCLCLMLPTRLGSAVIYIREQEKKHGT